MVKDVVKEKLVWEEKPKKGLTEMECIQGQEISGRRREERRSRGEKMLDA